LETHKHHQAQLESHKWFMDLLSDALKAEEWKRLRDPVRKEQDVAHRGRKVERESLLVRSMN